MFGFLKHFVAGLPPVGEARSMPAGLLEAGAATRRIQSASERTSQLSAAA